MINLSSIPYQSFWGKCLRFPLALIPEGMVLKILQGNLKGMKWIKGSSTNGCWIGTYELEKQKLFYTVLKPGQVIYDLGAHVGFYTLLSAKVVGTEGKVFSFEPVERNLYFLRKHIMLNQLFNVTILPYAVGNAQGFRRFYVTNSGFSEGKLSDQGNLTVEVIRLDDLMSNTRYPLPDVMKIDIEGSEYEALVGAEKTIITKKPIIFLATHGEDIKNNCFHFLKSHGYAIEPIAGYMDEFLCYNNG